MKKILSLIVVMALILTTFPVSMNALAATDVKFNITLLNTDGDAIEDALKPGDQFIVQIKSSVAVDTFGMYLTFNDDAFEASDAIYVEDDDEWKQLTCGSFVPNMEFNPEGLKDTISIGGMKVGESKLTCRMGFVVSENAVSGEYPVNIIKFVPEAMGMGRYNGIAGTQPTIVVENDAPAAPTAKDLGLFTDDSQSFKVTTPVMTSNEYAIEKALGFVSGIYADAAVVTYGTEITCEGFTKVLDIPAVNKYDAGENVKGFVAAVTSIRNDNLDKKFSAKAYADVTVGEETVRVYADETATAVYGK